MTIEEIAEKIYKEGYADGQNFRVPANPKDFPLIFDQAITLIKARIREKGLSEKRILRLCQIYLLPEVIRRESAEGLNAVGLSKAIKSEMDKAVEGV